MTPWYLNWVKPSHAVPVEKPHKCFLLFKPVDFSNWRLAATFDTLIMLFLFSAMWTLMNFVVSWCFAYNKNYDLIDFAFPSEGHHGLKCYLTFSQHKKRTILDGHMLKSLQAVWLKCHTNAASTKHPQPCPSHSAHKMLLFFNAFLLWRVFLPAPWWIRECSCCLRRPEFIHSESNGQNKEGKSMKTKHVKGVSHII